MKYQYPRLNRKFFARDGLVVAKDLIGKIICRNVYGTVIRMRITETEFYGDEKDSASHARFGKTKRSEIMWKTPGTIYIYLVYGMHHMLNFVTGKEGVAQAVLIRAVEKCDKPALLTRALSIDPTLNGLDATVSDKLWIEDDGIRSNVTEHKRIGIEYAKGEDKNKLYRFKLATADDYKAIAGKVKEAKIEAAKNEALGLTAKGKVKPAVKKPAAAKPAVKPAAKPVAKSAAKPAAMPSAKAAKPVPKKK